MHCSTVAQSLGLEPKGWPASNVSIICFLFFISYIHNRYNFILSFYAVSFNVLPIICLCGRFSYDSQIRKWLIVSSLISQETQRLSKYFQGCHVFISNVLDLKLKIILLNLVFLLFNKYSLVLSSEKGFLLCFQDWNSPR